MSKEPPLEKKCITIPADMVKWAKATSKKKRLNFSRFIVLVLAEKMDAEKAK